MSKKYYVYVVNGKNGITDTWPECQKIVSGVPGARYKGFATKDEAERWIDAGANYKTKSHELVNLEDGIYFDAGTGAGNGVEISVTDKNGKSLLHNVLDDKFINEKGFHLLGKEVTNNFGELLACKYALEIALRDGAKKIFGDSKLVVDYWSKGHIKKDNLSEETINLSHQTQKLRYAFEKNGGIIKQISGDHNPADLGFHK
jgi:ribonuclease HI